jgi:prepilin-type processing-associated H-X9-DG protein
MHFQNSCATPQSVFSSLAAGTQAFRHRGRTNVLFCDGHADSLKDRYLNASPIIGADTGFLSADNRRYNLD